MPDFANVQGVDGNLYNNSGYFTGTPSTQSAGMPSGTGAGSPGPNNAYYWLNLALQGASAYSNYSAQRQANKTNVALQREQQSWEEQMSNTAVQRRAADIEAAGGNRALAFTNGQEASTPTVTPARIDAPRIDPVNIGTAMLLKTQIDNIRAQTANTQAQTAGQNIKNNIDNAFAPQIAAINLDLQTLQKQNAEKNYDLLEQQIKNAVQTGANLQIQGAQSAAELGRFNQMTANVIALAMQQVRAGQLDLAALENVASVGGIEAGKAQGVISAIISGIKLFLMKK